MSKKEKPKILFQKIKYSGDRVQLDYMEKFQDYFNEITLDMAQQPMDSFKEAFNDLAEDVIEMAELPDPEGKLKNRIEINSIKIKYETEKEIPGIVISFKLKREKKSGMILINTPYQLLEERESGSSDQLVSEDTAEKIYHLLAEAAKYKDGSRKQIEMKFDSSEESKEPEDKKDDFKYELKIIPSHDFVVKTDPDLNGVIKPGFLITLNKLINIDDLIIPDERKGLFHLQNSDDVPYVDDNPRYAFSFRRNGDVFILQKILNEEISGMAPADINKNIKETLKYFSIYIRDEKSKSA